MNAWIVTKVGEAEEQTIGTAETPTPVCLARMELILENGAQRKTVRDAETPLTQTQERLDTMTVTKLSPKKPGPSISTKSTMNTTLL